MRLPSIMAVPCLVSTTNSGRGSITTKVAPLPRTASNSAYPGFPEARDVGLPCGTARTVLGAKAFDFIVVAGPYLTVETRRWSGPELVGVGQQPRLAMWPLSRVGDQRRAYRPSSQAGPGNDQLGFDEKLPGSVARRLRRVGRLRGVTWSGHVRWRRRRVLRRRRSSGCHALPIVRIVLLLQVTRGVLRISSADPGPDERTRGGSDAGATAAAHRGTERRPETRSKNRAADRLRSGLIAQRGNLCVGVLPACQIIIVGRLSHCTGAPQESRQRRAHKTFHNRIHRKLLLLQPKWPGLTAPLTTTGPGSGAFFGDARKGTADRDRGSNERKRLRSVGALRRVSPEPVRHCALPHLRVGSAHSPPC